jgi:hypothetical protein
VAATTDGDLEAALAAEAHGCLYVGRAVTAHHQGRSPVDQAVVNAPGIVICRIRGREGGAGKLEAKGIDRMSFKGHQDAPCRRKAPGVGPDRLTSGFR